MRPVEQRIPVDPLTELLDAFDGTVEALLGGQCSPDRRTYYRAVRTGGITVRSADRLARRLGLHPAEIWGHQWWSAA